MKPVQRKISMIICLNGKITNALWNETHNKLWGKINFKIMETERQILWRIKYDSS